MKIINMFLLYKFFVCRTAKNIAKSRNAQQSSMTGIFFFSMAKFIGQLVAVQLEYHGGTGGAVGAVDP